MAGGSSSHKDNTDVNIIAVLTICGVLFAQMLTHRLDLAVMKKKHARDLVEMMYKELMILGLVAFSLFAIERSSYIHIGHTEKEVFEDVHMTLFLIALFYACFIGVLTSLSAAISHQWDKIEDLEHTHWKELKHAHERLALKMGIDKNFEANEYYELYFLKHIITSPREWQRYRQLVEHIRFHELRLHFIKANHMPRNFHFVTYLKKCKQHVCLQLVEIRNGAWLAIAWLLSLDLYLKASLEKSYEKLIDIPSAIITCSIIVVIACVIIYLKIRHIYWYIMHSEFIHFGAANDPFFDASLRNSIRASIKQAKSQESIDFSRPHGVSIGGRPASVSVSDLPDEEQRQRSLFWFHKPSLLVSALQFIQFLLAGIVALFVQNITSISKNKDSFIFVCISLILAIFVFFGGLPQVITRYTLVTHVGEFVDRYSLSEALKKQQKKFKERAIPISLRQAYEKTNILNILTDWKPEGIKENLFIWIDSGSFHKLFNRIILLFFFILAMHTEMFLTHHHNSLDKYSYFLIFEFLSLASFFFEEMIVVYKKWLIDDTYNFAMKPFLLNMILLLFITISLILFCVLDDFQDKKICLIMCVLIVLRIPMRSTTFIRYFAKPLPAHIISGARVLGIDPRQYQEILNAPPDLLANESSSFLNKKGIELTDLDLKTPIDQYKLNNISSPVLVHKPFSDEKKNPVKRDLIKTDLNYFTETLDIPIKKNNKNDNNNDDDNNNMDKKDDNDNDNDIDNDNKKEESTDDINISFTEDDINQNTSINIIEDILDDEKLGLGKQDRGLSQENLLKALKIPSKEINLEKINKVDEDIINNKDDLILESNKKKDRYSFFNRFNRSKSIKKHGRSNSLPSVNYNYEPTAFSRAILGQLTSTSTTGSSTPTSTPLSSIGTNDGKIWKEVNRFGHEEHLRHALAQRLWNITLSEYPEIVARHGKYSTPVLRLMLGLPPYDHKNRIEQLLNLSDDDDDESGYQTDEDSLSTDSTSIASRLSRDLETPVLPGEKNPHVGGNPLRRMLSRQSLSYNFDENEAEERYLSTVIKHGKVLKKAKPLLMEWTEVDLILTRRELCYYIGPNEQPSIDEHNVLTNILNHRGKTSLNTIISCEYRDSITLKIKTPSYTFELRCPNEAETKIWLEYIQNAVAEEGMEELFLGI